MSTGTDISFCRKCGGIRKVRPNGSVVCPSCVRDRQTKYNFINKESIRAKSKEYKQNHKHSTDLKRSEYVVRNKERIAAGISLYYLNNKERISSIKKESRKYLHPLRNVWTSMRQRCRDKNVPNYHRYGGRGITVCGRWNNSFENFVSDVPPRPEPHYKYSLDRIDNDGNYEPGNVRWATRKEQSNNTKNSLSTIWNIPDGTPVKHNDSIVTVRELSDLTGIPLIVVKYRWSPHYDSRWIIDGDLGRDVYKFQGHMFTIPEISLFSGKDYQKLRSRIKVSGWSVERALNAF